MPLTTTWTRPAVSKCGWAFSSFTRPSAAELVARGDRVAQALEVADRADGLDGVTGDHRDPRGVISAVLEATETGEKQVLDGTPADIADDSAHGVLLSGGARTTRDRVPRSRRGCSN